MNIGKMVAASALLLTLTACVSAPVIRILDADKRAVAGSEFPEAATVYFFRGSSSAGSMCAFDIYMDGKEIGSVRRERYLAFPANGGAHQIAIEHHFPCGNPPIKLDIDFATEKTYYLYFEPDVQLGAGMSMQSSTSVALIDESFAKRLLDSYKPGAIKTASEASEKKK
ncbi:DUF2846 domain-containing protein [Permianibacter sp. IMCC34836]|uniref:DUF2846 domain-containing protein n=1 Tax=Permianibacter fluminis TaxID=2738515 RepID=UPI0015561BE0|nr:DUF2846 domain-containing protein [Permianibacter fluminis]NQD36403.1 DUF2846 domain-containing protein [Permianibacter fluminis]